MTPTLTDGSEPPVDDTGVLGVLAALAVLGLDPWCAELDAAVDDLLADTDDVHGRLRSLVADLVAHRS